MAQKKSSSKSGIICLAVIVVIFGYLGYVMGLAPMLQTIMATAHDLLLNTVFFLMAVCVVTGALGRIFVEFGVVNLLEKLLRPLMGPIFNLPGVASLGAVMTFLSDNPAIISLAQDKRFSSYFKKYQFISLTNFGTAFGMGLLVIVFMMGQGFFAAPLIGFFGAMCGCVVSTRLMQRFVIKAYPAYAEENACDISLDEEKEEQVEEKSLFIRILNSLLDGGKTGVDVGLSIIPGVLIISTFVMMLLQSVPESLSVLFHSQLRLMLARLCWVSCSITILVCRLIIPYRALRATIYQLLVSTTSSTPRVLLARRAA